MAGIFAKAFTWLSQFSRFEALGFTRILRLSPISYVENDTRIFLWRLHDIWWHSPQFRWVHFARTGLMYKLILSCAPRSHWWETTTNPPQQHTDTLADELWKRKTYSNCCTQNCTWKRKHCKCYQEAALSQGGPCDATVHFDMYRILQRHRAVSLPQHGFPV